jgi:hypothetical protein
MGIEVVHIPAGCAYLCKTIDVDIRIRLWVCSTNSPIWNSNFYC